MNYIVTVTTKYDIFNFGYANEIVAKQKANEIAISLTMHGVEYEDVECLSFNDFCKKYKRKQNVKL